MVVCIFLTILTTKARMKITIETVSCSELMLCITVATLNVANSVGVVKLESIYI